MLTTIITLFATMTMHLESGLSNVHRELIEIASVDETRRTPITKTELLDVLHDSHERALGEPPSDRVLASGWAQVAIENGRGEHIYNNNLGNIGAPVSGQRHYKFGTWRTHRYRSFKTHEDGGVAYWLTVKKCPAAYTSFKHGAVTEAAHRLKRCNYFGADAHLYAAAMEQLYAHAMSKLVPLRRGK